MEEDAASQGRLRHAQTKAAASTVKTTAYSLSARKASEFLAVVAGFGRQVRLTQAIMDWASR
jgi:hypothetical protein